MTVKANGLTYTTSNVGIDGDHSYELGSLAASVAHGKLFVNGSDYGPLENGDKIVIEADAVTVNGSRRTPVAEPAP